MSGTEEKPNEPRRMSGMDKPVVAMGEPRRMSDMKRRSGLMPPPMARRTSHLPMDGSATNVLNRRTSSLEVLEMARRATRFLQPGQHGFLGADAVINEDEEEVSGPSTSGVGQNTPPKANEQAYSSRRESHGIAMARSRGRRSSIGLPSLPSAPEDFKSVQEKLEQEAEVQPQGEFLGGSFKDRMLKHTRKSKEVSKALNLAPRQRNAVDVSHMVGHVKKVKFFQSMPLHVTEQICRVAQYKRLHDDDIICAQGDQGDSFFVLLSGSVSVHVVFPNDTESAKATTVKERHGKKVAVMTAGMCFGEVALICGQQRGASIISQEEGELLIITEEDYSKTLKRVMNSVFLPDSIKMTLKGKPLTRQPNEVDLIADVVQHHSFFEGVDRSIVREVATTAQFVTIDPKSRIYKQGDAARYVYIILTGTIELYRNTDSTYSPNQSHQTLETLSSNQQVFAGSEVPLEDFDISKIYGGQVITQSSGDWFGHVEVVSNTVREKTAITGEKIEMVCLERGAVSKLIEAAPGIFLHPDRIRRLLFLSPSKRKLDDLKTLAYYTESLEFMHALTAVNSEVVMAMLKVVGYTTFSAGEVIQRQGEAGTHFYIILAGSVTMHQRETESQQTTGESEQNAMELYHGPSGKDLVQKYGPCIRVVAVGQGFGELNLVNTEGYDSEELLSGTATFIAGTDVQVMTLNEKDYNRIVRHAHEQETTEKMALLRQTQGLYSVPYNKLLRLCVHMSLEKFPRGTTMIGEGLPATHIYFIKSGGCRVIMGGSKASRTKQKGSYMHGFNAKELIPGGGQTTASPAKRGQEFEVALVGPCESVGDFANLMGDAQPAKIVAATETEAYAVPIDSLEKSVPANIMDGLKAVSLQRIQKQKERYEQILSTRKKLSVAAEITKEASLHSLPPKGKLNNPMKKLDRHYTTGNRTLGRSIQSALDNYRLNESQASLSREPSRLPSQSHSAFLDRTAVKSLSMRTLPMRSKSRVEVGASASDSALVYQKSHTSLGLYSSPSRQGNRQNRRPTVVRMSAADFAESRRQAHAESRKSLLRSSRIGARKGPPDPLREREVSTAELDDLGLLTLRNSDHRIYEVDIPDGSARLRYSINERLPTLSSEYTKQLVYDYTREHLNRIAQKKVPLATAS